MKTSQEIKEMFNTLPLGLQNELLGDLLIEQELQGKVLLEASEEVSINRTKKPCPYCLSKKVYKRGKQKGVQIMLEKIKNATNRIATVTAIAFTFNSAWMEFKNIAYP